MSDYIPNSFMTPNAIVDNLMHLLDSSEFRVLVFAIRHIIGWDDSIAQRRAQISLSMFVDGFVTQAGKRFHGCGLSVNTVRGALRRLEDFNIVRRVENPNATGEHDRYLYDENGQWYELPFLMGEAINTWKLNERASKLEKKHANQTKQARKALEVKKDRNEAKPLLLDRGGQSNSGEGSLSDSTPRSLLDSGEGSLSDSADETHLETHPETQEKPTPPSPPDGGGGNFDVIRFYEENIGPVTALHLKQELLSAAEDYPEKWVRRAIEIAVENGKYKWSYAAGILRRWHTDGYDGDNKPQQGRGDTWGDHAQNGSAEKPEPETNYWDTPQGQRKVLLKMRFASDEAVTERLAELGLAPDCSPEELRAVLEDQIS